LLFGARSFHSPSEIFERPHQFGAHRQPLESLLEKAHFVAANAPMSIAWKSDPAAPVRNSY
jgi:hypothetical protein